MRRQEEAMRIMEALSGVDEELLARCEAADTAEMPGGTAKSRKGTGRPEGRRSRKQSPWYYLSRCAAVLALAAVGAASWRGLRVSEDLAADESALGGSSGAAVLDSAFNTELEEDYSEGMETNGNAVSESKFMEKDFWGGSEGASSVPAGAGSDSNGGSGTDSADAASGGTDGAAHAVTAEKQVTEDCLALTVRMLTEDEARQIDLLGDYVPTALPADCAFKSARYEEETGRLTIRWSRGVDDIMLSFEQVDRGAAGMGDNIFSDPVFAKDDFSLEIVRSRVLSYSGDSDDTSTPRGQFSVLYDGVLVCFSGRGTPEEIWEMFASISEQ